MVVIKVSARAYYIVCLTHHTTLAMFNHNYSYKAAGKHDETIQSLFPWRKDMQNEETTVLDVGTISAVSSTQMLATLF